MKRTGKHAGLFCVLLIALTAGIARGQTSPNVEATISQNTIYTGERVEFTIEISGNFTNVSRPDIPAIPGFRLLSNTPSTSRSFNFINGRSSTSYAYTYYLTAERSGTYEIPSVPVTIDGDRHETNAIRVTVIDRNESADDPSADSRPEIYLEMEVSDERPVSGQQLIADVVLYFRDELEVNSFQPVPGWKAEGFWKEELDNSQSRRRAETTVLNGVRYNRVSLLQFALFPTKSGKLTISPYEVVTTVRSSSSRDDPFSSFFGGFGSNQRQVELESDPLTLNVRPLPDREGNRATLGVGDFSITRNISRREVTVGESIEIETVISGTGNLPLLSKPDYPFPDGLETYTPRENSMINRENRRISGRKIFTDVVVARIPGSHTIPETTLSWFDPEIEDYRHQTLPALTVTAVRSPDTVTPSTDSRALAVQPVTGLTSWTGPRSAGLLDRWWFWTGITFPLLLLAVGYWQKTYHEKMSNDPSFARSVRAPEKADERLREAIRLSKKGSVKEAYHRLQKALTGFIGDRLGLPEAGLSIQQYVSALEEEDVNPELIKNIRLLLDKCATISYAPDTTHEYLKSHVDLAQSTLEKLMKEL